MYATLSGCVRLNDVGYDRSFVECSGYRWWGFKILTNLIFLKCRKVHSAIWWVRICGRRMLAHWQMQHTVVELQNWGFAAYFIGPVFTTFSFSMPTAKCLKPCPHCRRKVRRKRRDNGDSRRIRWQSHFAATVAVFGDKLSPKSATIVASVDRLLISAACNIIFDNHLMHLGVFVFYVSCWAA